MFGMIYCYDILVTTIYFVFSFSSFFSDRLSQVRKRYGVKTQRSRRRNSNGDQASKGSVINTTRDTSLENYHIPKLSHSLSEVIKQTTEVAHSPRTRSRSTSPPTKRSKSRSEVPRTSDKVETARKILSCDECPATYKDRTGLYKHKHKKHLHTSTVSSVHKTNLTMLTELIPVADTPVIASTLDVSICSGSITAPLTEDVLELVDMVFPAQEEIYSPQTSVANTVFPKMDLTLMTTSINDLFSSKDDEWTLPPDLLTSDYTINNWLMEFAHNTIKCTTGHIASRIRRAIVEDVANPGHEMRRVAGLALFLDNKFAGK